MICSRIHWSVHPSRAARWLALALCAFAFAAWAPSSAAAPTPREYTLGYLDHTRTGEYEAFGLLERDWMTPYALGPDGAPTPTYAFGPATNPTTTAQYGLANWSLWVRYRDRERRAKALETADWFVEHQRRRAGTWTYGFDYVAPGAGALSAPWASALAQGQAISLLRRAYRATGERRYLLAARRGLRPFRRGVAAGGLVRRWAGHPFYEEYPTRRGPMFVLNGFQQALLGLYDLSDVSPLARRLFRRGMRTLPLVLPEYDLGGSVSAYSLAHRFWGGAPTLAQPSYHLAHVGLLRLLNRISPDPVLRRYARRWSQRLAFG